MQEEGFVKVVFLIDGMLVLEVGIEVGDFIIYVDGESVLGLILDEVVDMMCGFVGFEIIIIIVCEGEIELFDVFIICDMIKLMVVCLCIEGDSIVLCVIIFND